MIFIFCRTDLALEASEALQGRDAGVKRTVKTLDDIKITEIEILNESAAKNIGKPIGSYVTVELSHLTDNYREVEAKVTHISQEIKKLLPKKGLILVVGLGNSSVTPDALGPKTIESVLATRHITGELARSTGLDKLRGVAALAPGVLGQTGIEVSEVIASLAHTLKPSGVIAIDALAARKTSRLGTTIQISNTGICPGAGVGNARPAIDENTLGVPVLGIGVPTVVDAMTLAADIVPNFDEKQLHSVENKVHPRGEPMMVTPREIDLLIERAAKMIAMSINCALHPNFSYSDLLELIS